MHTTPRFTSGPHFPPSTAILQLVVDELGSGLIVPLHGILVGRAVAAARAPLVASVAVGADLASVPVDAIELDATTGEGLYISVS